MAAADEEIDNIRWDALKGDRDLRWKGHEDQHAMLANALRVAMQAIERERALHVTAHEAAHDAHNREHMLDTRAEGLATASHEKEHHLEKDARDKAELAIDKRLLAMNEFRAQLKDQASEFARVDALDRLTERVIAIEKLDIKGEGRSLGQGAVIALIVTLVGLAATVLGIIIVVSNALSTG